MLKNPVHSLRMVALTEGVSFLVLLGVAMPLKYAAGRPEAVLIVGWAHGILFLLLCALLLFVLVRGHWPLSRAAMVFIAALLPFGPFVIDGRLRRYDEAADPHAGIRPESPGRSFDGGKGYAAREDLVDSSQ